jgi:hypothetical protein
VLHGGSIPAVREAARRRLFGALDPALDWLMQCLRTGAPCEHCGRSDLDRDPVVMRAVQLVVDRCFHPSMAVPETPTASGPDYRGWIPQDRLAQITLWLTEARAAMERGDPQPDQIVDAVIGERNHEPAVLVEGEAGDDAADGFYTEPQQG